MLLVKGDGPIIFGDEWYALHSPQQVAERMDHKIIYSDLTIETLGGKE